MYSAATQLDVVGSWAHNKDDSAKDQIPFSRPAITTGAHMPWTNRNRTNYVAPRAFTNQQTVPPITILNQKQEYTKLIFSKEPQPSTMIVPAKTPFQHVAHISLSDEEGQSAKPASKPSTVVRPSEMRPTLTTTKQNAAATKRDQSSAASTSTQAHLNFQVQPGNLQLKINTSSAVVKQGPVVKSEPLTVSSSEAFTNLGDSHLSSDSLAEKQMLETQGDEKLQSNLVPDCVMVQPDQNVPSLLERSSGDSTQMLSAEKLPKFEEATANLKMEHLDGFWTATEMNDDSLDVASLAPGKRKAVSWDGAGDDKSLREYLSSNVAFSGRSLKRRLSPKALASKNSEKKSSDFRRMENMVFRLKNEQEELHDRLRKQTKTCDELRESLQTAEQKLKEQEDLNSKLMLEMQFLKSSLFPIPEDGLQGIQTPGRSGTLAAPSLAPSGGLQELPWMDRLASICMPTLAEVAADFETDCPLIQPPEGSMPQDWQIW